MPNLRKGVHSSIQRDTSRTHDAQRRCGEKADQKKTIRSFRTATGIRISIQKLKQTETDQRMSEYLPQMPRLQAKVRIEGRASRSFQGSPHDLQNMRKGFQRAHFVEETRLRRPSEAEAVRLHHLRPEILPQRNSPFSHVDPQRRENPRLPAMWQILSTLFSVDSAYTDQTHEREKPRVSTLSVQSVLQLPIADSH